jgi:hypothetical protein
MLNRIVAFLEDVDITITGVYFAYEHEKQRHNYVDLMFSYHITHSRVIDFKVLSHTALTPLLKEHLVDIVTYVKIF